MRVTSIKQNIEAFDVLKPIPDFLIILAVLWEYTFHWSIARSSSTSDEPVIEPNSVRMVKCSQRKNPYHP